MKSKGTKSSEFNMKTFLLLSEVYFFKRRGKLPHIKQGISESNKYFSTFLNGMNINNKQVIKFVFHMKRLIHHKLQDSQILYYVCNVIFCIS